MIGHPDACAKHLRLRSTWRDLSERGSRDHEALDWQDACMALAGSDPVAFQAFQLRHSEDPPGRELVAHLLDVARRALIGNDKITPDTVVGCLLQEERAPVAQRTEKHRYMAAGVSRHAWERYVARSYALVGQELDCLVSSAWRVARARLDAA